MNREFIGMVVRKAWVEWAKEQSNPKPSWLKSWEELSESEKEVDRRIGEAVLAKVSYNCPKCKKVFYTETPYADQVSMGSHAKFELPELCRSCDASEQNRETREAVEKALKSTKRFRQINDYESSTRMCPCGSSVKWSGFLGDLEVWMAIHAEHVTTTEILEETSKDGKRA